MITEILLTTAALSLWSWAMYRFGYVSRRLEEEVEKAEFRRELLVALIEVEKKNAEKK